MTELEKMRNAGNLAARVLDFIGPYVIAGTTTDELNNMCHDYILSHGAIPAPLNYKGFPKSICTSVNHQICHGIPSDKRLRNGDIINIDVTVILDEYHGDTSRMYFVGKPSVRARRLVNATYDAMMRGIEAIKPGERTNVIGRAIEEVAKKHRLSIVEEFCGHGIGKIFHDFPSIFHYDRGNGDIIEPGMFFTVEPMLNIGKRHVHQLPDGWTIITRDRSLSAQWEHTVAVLDDGYEILTV